VEEKQYLQGEITRLERELPKLRDLASQRQAELARAAPGSGKQHVEGALQRAQAELKNTQTAIDGYKANLRKL